LLRGMFRGDGYSNPKRGSLLYSTVSPDLAFGTKILLDRLGICSTIRTQQHKNRKHLAYNVRIDNGLYVEKLSKLIDFPLKAEPGPGSDRLLDRNDGYIYHRVKSATRGHYIGTVHNLWVADTNNYVVPSGVVSNCIPVDPYYLVDKAKEHGYRPVMIETALYQNERQPNQVKHWIIDTLIGKGIMAKRSKILVLGVAFKKDVSDTRESPAIELLHRLYEYGMDILYNDPYVPRLSERMMSEELDDELLESADCVVIATDHSCYDWKWIVDKAKLVFDTRNATRGLKEDNIYRLGERKE